MICPKCHAKDGKGKFCGHCGAALIEDGAPVKTIHTETAGRSSAFRPAPSLLDEQETKTILKTDVVKSSPSVPREMTGVSGKTRMTEVTAPSPVMHKTVIEDCAALEQPVVAKKGKLAIKIIICASVVLATMSLAVLSAYLAANNKIPWLSKTNENQVSTTQFSTPQNPEITIVEAERADSNRD